ncbi:MAG: LamG domain-containing protein, partial [Cyanobacteria bacterium P01_G01_bin.38]
PSLGPLNPNSDLLKTKRVGKISDYTLSSRPKPSVPEPEPPSNPAPEPPTDPVDPVEPVDPVDPLDPVDPVTPGKPVPGVDKPVAYLKLDEQKGKIAKDSSVNGLNNRGALINTAEWLEQGAKNGAVTLDGKGSGIRLRNSKDINQGIHKQRTVSLWFKADKTAPADKQQVIYEEGGGVRGLNIYLEGDHLCVGGWNRSAQQSNWDGTWLKTDNKLSANQWYHVALVLDGGSSVTGGALKGYLNGQEFGEGEGSQLWSHTGGIGLGTTNRGTRFHNRTVGGGSSLTGAIDEVMIFNDALNGNEIEALATT